MLLNHKEIKDFKVGEKALFREYVPVEEVTDAIQTPQHEAKIFECEITYIDDKEVRVKYKDNEYSFLIKEEHSMYAYSKNDADRLLFSCELGYLNFIDQTTIDLVDYLNF